MQAEKDKNSYDLLLSILYKHSSLVLFVILIRIAIIYIDQYPWLDSIFLIWRLFPVRFLNLYKSILSA